MALRESIPNRSPQPPHAAVQAREGCQAMEEKSVAGTARADDSTLTAQMINAEQFARILGVSRRTLWRLLSAGKLVEPIRFGGSTRWRSDDVRRWIDNGCPSDDK